MDIYENLKKLNITLPKPPATGGIYAPIKEFGHNLMYTSGIGPVVEGFPAALGKLGKDLTLEQGQQAAKAAMLNVLSVMESRLGDLNKVKNIVKILGFVASDDNFIEQPQVMNPASQILIDVFGDKIGRAARSAIGINVLPGNIPVEIELIFEAY